MPLSPRNIFAALAVFLATIASSNAELPQAQIATAMRSPAGMTWAVSNPEATPWTVDASGVHLANVPTGSSAWIEATVTGPGVAGLNSYQSYWELFNQTVWIDGVQSGAILTDGYGAPRAQVGPGVHTVRWQFVRTNKPSYSQLDLQHASWKPFTETPLNSALVGEGVTLSSPGLNPWIGQDALHHGDGAGAWSGLKVDPLPTGQVSTDAPLRATFEGPGIFTFWHRTYGNGQATLRFDNGSDSHIYSHEWKRTRRLVGAGPHVAEWRATSYPGSAQRSSFDMAVDEIQLLPLIPFATALETPGREWTAAPASGDATQAYGIPDPDASGGSMVTGFGTGISTPVSGPALLKIRYRGNTPGISVDGYFTTGGLRIEGPDAHGWEVVARALPDEAMELTLAGSYNTEIDKVEFLAPPPTLSSTLGLAEGILTSGGPDAWTVSPYEELGGFGARIEVPYGHEESWLEMPVEGPAEVRFFWKSGTYNYNRDFSVQVDGKELEAMNGYVSSSQVRIEVPAGSHKVRWVARAPRSSWLGPNTAYIATPEILPIPPNGGALSALGLDQPVVFPPGWSASGTFTQNGTPALQAPPLENMNPHSTADYEIKSRFTGPGLLSFWWYAAPPVASSGSARWFFEGERAGDEELRRDASEAPGWKREQLWLPPGDALFRWNVEGWPDEVALTALDQIKFTPSPAASLGEAVDAPSLVWETTPYAPWTGFVVESPSNDVAISPNLTAGQSAILEAEVEGPGTISFRWKRFGSNTVQGEFQVPDGPAIGVYSDGDREEYFIPSTGPALLHWIAKGREWATESDSWIGVDEVVWTPLPVRPLEQVLDAPSAVRWKTSADTPFTGRDDPGAVGGSSAYVAVKEGQEAWLEATVNGPGLFDFWLREVPGFELSWDLWDYWSLTIDDQPVAIDGTTWPAQWITGDGPHRIRLTLKNPVDGYDLFAGAVDQVSWIPMGSMPLVRATGLKKNIWKVDPKRSPAGMQGAGRDGAPAALMRTGTDATSWMQTTVKGPCEVSWDSTASMNWQAGDSRISLMIDGKRVMDFYEHEWERMRLTLPAGAHVLRWVSEPWGYDEEPSPEETGLAFDSTWRIGGMEIKQGLSLLARALDAPSLFALERGDDGGTLKMVGGNDVWEPGGASTLYLFSPGKSGRYDFRWGRPDGGSGILYLSDLFDYYTLLQSDEAGWRDHSRLLREGSHLEFTYEPDHWADPEIRPPYLDALTVDTRAPRSLASAIESKQEVESEDWLGMVSSRAKSDRDYGCSLIGSGGVTELATTTLTGPARVSYWWKKAGPGILRLKVDGGFIPVPEPPDSWTQVEFNLGTGEHSVQWVHATQGQGHLSPAAEASLDGLTIRQTDGLTLSQVAATDPAFVLDTTASTPGALPWHPVSYKEADGSWTEAARVISGSRVLKTTVQGPAQLRFKARCFDGYPQGNVISPASSESIIIGPGGYPQTLSQHLSVEVDGAARAKIEATTNGAWQEIAVEVPSGTHDITFRLMALKTRLWREYVTDSDDPDLQGWVDDLEVFSESAFSATSATSPPPPDRSSSMDSDGDGSSDELERCFGTNPLDFESKPPDLRIISANQGAPVRILEVPYIHPDASAWVETSCDLQHWEKLSTPLRSSRKPSTLSEPSYDTETMQGIPLTSDEACRYYRVQFDGFSDN